MIRILQRLRQALREGHAFISQIVHQRLPAGVLITATQDATQQSMHFGRRHAHTLLREGCGQRVVSGCCVL